MSKTRSRSLYKAVVITPQQTLATLNKLTNPLHYMLVLTCAAMALRVSEIISLRWSDNRSAVTIFSSVIAADWGMRESCWLESLRCEVLWRPPFQSPLCAGKSRHGVKSESLIR
jgi:hypothetical protein